MYGLPLEFVREGNLEMQLSGKLVNGSARKLDLLPGELPALLEMELLREGQLPGDVLQNRLHGLHVVPEERPDREPGKAHRADGIQEVGVVEKLPFRCCRV